MNRIQNEFQPDYISPPGDTLLEVLESLGMTQAELALRTGRPKKTINEIVQGKTAITPDTALQLELSLGIPATFWLNREQQYREALARIQHEEQLQAQIAWLDHFPVREMCQKEWVSPQANKAEQVRELLAFFGVATSAQYEQIWGDHFAVASFRQSTAKPANWAAVAAWLRKGELEAQTIDCHSYNEQTFRQVLNVIRTVTTKALEDSWERIVELCGGAGVAAVIVSELPETRLFGASRWLNPHKAIIQLSLRYKSDDHFWFSFFHEAGHILLHNKSTLYLESDDDDQRQISQQEDDANQFAADLLIPPAELRRFLAKRRVGHPISKVAVVAFAQELGIAPGIVVGRLQYDGYLAQKNLNGLKRKVRWDNFGQIVTY